MLRTALLMLLAAAVFPGCDRESRWGSSWPGEAERTMSEGRAPTPFTADQIRAGCPSGRRSTWRIQESGGKASLQMFTFRDAGEEDVRVVMDRTSLEGKPLVPRRESRVPWSGLQAHASYPRDATVIERETLHVPAGWFHCMRYTVETRGEPGRLTKAWFARELPGPPVLLEEHKNGKVIFRMTLARNEIVPSEKE